MLFLNKLKLILFNTMETCNGYFFELEEIEIICDFYDVCLQLLNTKRQFIVDKKSDTI